MSDTVHVPEGSLSRIRKVVVDAETGGKGDPYASMNKNSDGAGLSFGLINWAQKVGGLHELLHVMWVLAPRRFVAAFGPAYYTMLMAVAKKSLDPVDGALLWHEPWLSRFAAAAADPELRKAQDYALKYGSYMTRAIKLAVRADMTSERSLALIFDRSVQQGSGRASGVIDQIADWNASERQKQKRFRDLIVPMAGKWQESAGQRADAILYSPDLSDEDVIFDGPETYA